MELINEVAKFKTFADMVIKLPDEKSCRLYLESILWPNGPVCPVCKAKEHYKLSSKGEFKGLYKCTSCKQRFTVAKGTMFEASHIPYRIWLITIFLFQAHKKGISSLQVSRDVGVTQKTAWFMLHRIRYAMGLPIDGKLDGRVELDETFVGGKNKNRHKDKKVEHSQGRSFKDKTPVMGMLQEAVFETVTRPYKNNPEKTVTERIYKQPAIVKCQVVPDTKATSIQPIIKENVKYGCVIISDEWIAYQGLNALYDHRIVDHRAKQYVTEAGDTSNALEGFWTWIKRSNMGIYHVMSREHMQQYANEMAFRYNTHRLKDKERFDMTLQQTSDRRLRYKDLVKKKPKPQEIPQESEALPF